MRSIMNLGSGLFAVLRKPIESGYQNGEVISLYKGLLEGVGTLYTAVSEETHNVRKKITKVI